MVHALKGRETHHSPAPTVRKLQRSQPEASHLAMFLMPLSGEEFANSTFYTPLPGELDAVADALAILTTNTLLIYTTRQKPTIDNQHFAGHITRRVGCKK